MRRACGKGDKSWEVGKEKRVVGRRYREGAVQGIIVGLGKVEQFFLQRTTEGTEDKKIIVMQKVSIKKCPLPFAIA